MRKKLTACVIVCFLTLASTTQAKNDKDHKKEKKGPLFEAELIGENEVPPVETEMTARLRIRFAEDQAEFRLKIQEGEGVLQAHLHCGAEGQNGPVIAFLMGLFQPATVGVDIPRGEIDGFLLKDSNVLPDNTCSSVIGRSITDLADVIDAARDGLIYANVHTVANPGGEVRAQLEEIDNKGGNR